MPASTRIPPLLQPYLQLPREDSLLLLTSNLGATANWLLVRYLSDALSSRTQDGAQNEGHNVVLVSWMREYEFWKQEARKAVGLDLDKASKEGRFAFVDGLSKVSLGAPKQTSGITSPVRTAPRVLPATFPTGRVLPARGPPPSSTPATNNSTTIATAHSASADPSSTEHDALTNLDLAHIKNTITAAISDLASSASTPRKTLLVLDNPDLLLALNPAIDPHALISLLLTFHTLPVVSHILTHIQSDAPLLSLSTPAQPLELAHHNFLVKYAHMSRRIVGVRVLDTGVARDVGGVVRVTEQEDDWVGLALEEDGKDGENREGKEFLYQIKGDGSVRVFERGAGGEG